MTNGSPLFLDELTGLPNRACFLDRLSEAADEARAHKRALATRAATRVGGALR